VREAIVRAVPTGVRIGVAAGIGLFLALIGMINAGVIVASPATTVAFGGFSATFVLFFVGLVLAAFLMIRKVPGALILSIVATSVLALVFQSIGWVEDQVFLPTALVAWPSLATVFALDFGGLLTASLIAPVFALLFTDLFDSISTFVGVTKVAGLTDAEGHPKNAGKALLVDGVSTTISGLLGTSPGTAYIESAAGVEAGGRSGLTAVVAGLLFLPFMFFSPLLGLVPAVATAPILVLVGLFMMSTLSEASTGTTTRSWCRPSWRWWRSRSRTRSARASSRAVRSVGCGDRARPRIARVRRLLSRIRNAIRKRMHVGPRDHGAIAVAAGLARRDDRVLCGRHARIELRRAVGDAAMSDAHIKDTGEQPAEPRLTAGQAIKYLAIGIYFGIVLVKAEVVSWFRIQEMFHFQSIHMFGIIGLAVVVGAVSIALLRATRARSVEGIEITPEGKPFDRIANPVGGLIFGFGWALTGACPGPLYANLGAGYWPVLLAIAGVIAGVIAYGALKPRLPH
jgi:hypothetical protein